MPLVYDRCLIVGAGIGGLSAALALLRNGRAVTVLEQAQTIGEIGAGLQLGPNAMRRLYGWGLQTDLARHAAFPKALQVRSANSGTQLGVLPLGDTALTRYGAPYATMHRADLHHTLFNAALAAGAQLLTGHSGIRYTEQPHGVTVHVQHEGTTQYSGDCLIGADGLRSAVRQQLLHDGAPQASGHVVYRVLVPQHALPERLRSSIITVWLGPQLHVVQYPVRGGDWLNVAAIVHGTLPSEHTVSHQFPESWNHAVHAHTVRAALQTICVSLQDLIEATAPNDWRAWTVFDRPPVHSPSQMAYARVALLGDAAHPMRPYLAQGAGMAIEDAQALALALQSDSSIEQALQHYAALRWQRNAQVQKRALRNGQVFHASGALRFGRDAAMRLLGPRLLDVPWLYGH